MFIIYKIIFIIYIKIVKVNFLRIKCGNKALINVIKKENQFK